MNAPPLMNDHKILDHPNVCQVQFSCATGPAPTVILPGTYTLDVYLAESNKQEYSSEVRPAHYILYAEIRLSSIRHNPTYHAYLGTDKELAINTYEKLIKAAGSGDYYLKWTPETDIVFRVGNTYLEIL